MDKCHAFIVLKWKCTWQDANSPANSRATAMSDLSEAVTADIMFQGSRDNILGTSRANFECMLFAEIEPFSLHLYFLDKCVNRQLSLLREKTVRECKNSFGSTLYNT